MTKLLNEAFVIVSENFSQQDQDKLAYLMIENIDRLREFLEYESDEEIFDKSVIEAVKSENVQNLFRKVAEKYTQNFSDR